MKKQDILAAVEAKRGYLLSYHRLLAADDPDLLGAYDTFYEKLTLTQRVLSKRERELVWVGMLAAAREVHGSIHLRRATEAGLDAEALSDAVALAGAAESFAAMDFATVHWNDWIAQDAAVTRYLKLAGAARGGIAENLAEIILICCHAAQRRHTAQQLHLARAFEAGATVGQIAEAMSYLLLPCGGPVLIDAVECWERAARDGHCPPPYDE